MGSPGARNMLDAPVAKRRRIEAAKKIFARSQQARRDGQVHLVNQFRPQVLLNGGDTAAKPNVLSFGGFRRLLKRGVNTIRDEVERRPARHGKRFAWMVRQHENRAMVRRVIAPPTFPVLVRPGASDRPEHVSPDDPGAHIVKPALGECVVDAHLATVLTMHFSERDGREKPFVKSKAAYPKRVGKILVRARAVAIERYGEAIDAQFGHRRFLPC